MRHKSSSISNLKSTISNLRRWWPVVAWMGLIFFLSAQPKLPPILGLGFLDRLDYGDKIKHFIGYGALAILIWRALGDARPKRRRFWIVVAISTVYGMTDEFHQRFVPNRCCDILDLTADALGALCAAAILYTGGIRYGGREESKKRKERI